MIRKTTVASSAAPAATARPAANVLAATPAADERRRTMATHNAASAPYSGPTTIAPMINTGESSRMPIAAIIAATAMNDRKDAVRIA